MPADLGWGEKSRGNYCGPDENTTLARAGDVNNIFGGILYSAI